MEFRSRQPSLDRCSLKLSAVKYSRSWLSPQLLWLVMTHMHSRQSARTTRSLRYPDLGGSLWNITTQGEKECLLCCTRGQVVVEVQHVTQAPYVLSTMFVYQRKNTHMIGSRSMSGLTHSVWLWWSGSVCCRSYKGTRLKCSGSWISQDLEHKFILIRWSEACTKKRITLSNPVWKNNKIAAMPSLCSWHSREMVIDLQQLLSFFSYLRYLLNRLLHWFLGRQMVVCMLQDNWRNEELFSSVDQIRYRP